METSPPYSIWGSPELRRWPRSVRFSILFGGAGLLWLLGGLTLAVLATLMHLTGMARF